MKTNTQIAQRQQATVEAALYQDALIRAIGDAITEGLKGYALGVPAGHLYGILMGFGLNLDGFNAVMGALVKLGRVTKVGDLYFHPEVRL